MKTLLVLALAVAVAYALLVLVVVLAQGRLVWFPGPPPSWTPADAGLAYRELELVAADGVRLHAWLVEPPGEPLGAVCYSHGNAGSIANRIEPARALVEAGFAVLLYDYRGYGNSEGAPSEEGTYLDAVAAHERLVAEGFPPARIVAWGESLGAAVAIELARRRPVAAVVVEAPFTSIADLGAELYPWLPVRLLSRIRYDNASKVGELGTPLLVLHSPADRLVPIRHGRALVEAAAPPKRLLETGGGHNDGGFLLRDAWKDEVAAFLREAVSS